MVCIYCGHKTTVTNSRLQKKLNQTWRRRKCSSCSSPFTTVEATYLPTSLLYKNSHGHIRPFERDILFISIYEACKHRKTATRDSTALTSTIISQLQPKISQASITREDLIKIAIKTLGRFDKVAAVHYGAYHPV